MAVVIESSNSVYYAGTDRTASIVCPAPVSIAVGDLLVAVIGVKNTSDRVTTPAGWTKTAFYCVGEEDYANVLYKIADSADVSAANFTFALTDGIYYCIAVVLRISGFSASQPLSIGSINASVNNDTRTPSINATITPYPNSMLLMITLTSYGNSAPALTMSDYAIATDNPAWTEVVDIWQLNGGSGSDAQGLSIAKATRPESSATGNCSWVISEGGTTSYLGANAIMLAVNLSHDFSVTDTMALTDSGNKMDFGIYMNDAVVMTENMTNSEKIWSNTNKNEVTVTNQTKS